MGLDTQGAREIKKRKDHDTRGGWVPKIGYLRRKAPPLKSNRRKTWRSEDKPSSKSSGELSQPVSRESSAKRKVAGWIPH